MKEPYIPYFPEPCQRWNGMLVVAEAQNLSDKRRTYRSWLQSIDTEAKWDRLNKPDVPLEGIGVGPWDDGTMKLTLAAIEGAECVPFVAVSNAVLWSDNDSSASERLDSVCVEASISFWNDMLTALHPTKVFAFGSRPARVMTRANSLGVEILDLPGPFARKYQIGYKLNQERLLAAFPEVACALQALDENTVFRNRAAAIHCACDAVSRLLNGQSCRL